MPRAGVAPRLSYFQFSLVLRPSLEGLAAGRYPGMLPHAAEKEEEEEKEKENGSG
jgi:hypothetical protein